MKRLLILGSTGSIGKNTLKLVKEFNGEFEIAGLTAHSNIDLLQEQIEEFKPPTVVVSDRQNAKILGDRIGERCEILYGEEGLLEIAKRNNYDILLSAIVGFAGLKPTIESIKLGKRIALANKETLVVAGELIIELAKKFNSEIIPVDSEHSAIFQCLQGESKKEIEKIILTASGGPFLNRDKTDFESVTIEEALNHPNWNMGNKITIDSATMMNKGLEVIEAYWLFGLKKEQIEVLIHPQSVIHSMVAFRDGSIKAQLSAPDMKLPILYALTYPNRLNYGGVKTDFKKIAQLTFFEPDFDKFVCLKLAYDAIDKGGIAPCILNAANELAVDKFLSGEIKFSQIPVIIEDALDNLYEDAELSLEIIESYDKKTRNYINNRYK
ncbi:1-deoxy-D-xylulose 5-phosphate reductoisomerase [Melioribacter roseus P3M-2]|uniref:1-deoxy-D-xylulose 5-phosphate reductoisomerase n=1 Tax=Melioribacter roseus (strain DSM 23840 / JCM 17771 / VKM B-2668 / P3M-2) TaxID=1191523 RepID=I6YTR8_MELRP|nr:1-deoxy-D-xylulose-5-phosphate reductoisomerase [Melioribacter roseus]AFN73902.1 1-deoxy-D-xylulose 5-phosphate reductoisomerase [Melioribacter roseus P3M-2]